MIQEVGQIVDDDRRAMCSERITLANAVDANHETEAAGVSRFDSGQRILEHGCLRSGYVQQTRRFEIAVRRGLAVQVVATGDHAVHDSFEFVGQSAT